MLASATRHAFECAIVISTKRLASWYRAPREGSRTIRLRNVAGGMQRISDGTHGRGGSDGTGVNNYVDKMSTRCAHVRRSEASIAFKLSAPEAAGAPATAGERREL
jgi:hypothetical protein